MNTGVDAFKGPIDLFVPNGNFGFDFGFNLGIPLAKELGIGVQAGGRGPCSLIFQGTAQADDFSTPTSEIRQQTFYTIGLFQRLQVRDCIFSWGFTHDWLFDDYYTEMNFAQWRVKLGVQWNPWNELGIWAAMPDHGATATVRSVHTTIPLSLDGPREPLLAARLVQRRHHHGMDRNRSGAGRFHLRGRCPPADHRAASRWSATSPTSCPAATASTARTMNCGTCTSASSLCRAVRPLPAIPLQPPYAGG